jgi:hypothetical protein
MVPVELDQYAPVADPEPRLSATLEAAKGGTRFGIRNQVLERADDSAADWRIQLSQIALGPG